MTALDGTAGSLGYAELVERTLDALAATSRPIFPSIACHRGAGERGLMLSIRQSIFFAALVIERLAGYPKFLHDRIGHPVEWIGAVIRGFEEAVGTIHGSASAEIQGRLALLLTSAGRHPTVPFSLWLRHQAWGWMLEAVLATSFWRNSTSPATSAPSIPGSKRASMVGAER